MRTIRHLGSLAFFVFVIVVMSSCATTQRDVTPPTFTRALTATAYCKCGKCCNWHRNWFFRPVIAAGPHKGQRKKVGITASGTRVHVGTIAADTSRYPFGTIMYVPGYGYGRVEDRGGAIQGDHIDLYFKRHHEAERWGRVKTEVSVWLPGATTQARSRTQYP